MPRPLRIGSFSQLWLRAFPSAQASIRFNDANDTQVAELQVRSSDGNLTFINNKINQQFGFGSTGFGASVINAVTLKVSSLSGTGTRNVAVDANGTLIVSNVSSSDSLSPFLLMGG